MNEAMEVCMKTIEYVVQSKMREWDERGWSDLHASLGEFVARTFLHEKCARFRGVDYRLLRRETVVSEAVLEEVSHGG